MIEAINNVKILKNIELITISGANHSKMPVFANAISKNLIKLVYILTKSTEISNLSYLGQGTI